MVYIAEAGSYIFCGFDLVLCLFLLLGYFLAFFPALAGFGYAYVCMSFVCCEFFGLHDG